MQIKKCFIWFPKSIVNCELTPENAFIKDSCWGKMKLRFETFSNLKSQISKLILLPFY